MNNARPGQDDACRALWYTAPGVAELRREAVGPVPDDHVLLRLIYSGISRGTERLVAAGGVPPGERERMRAPLMAGNFPFPVKYGYAAVGIVQAGPSEMVGETLFALAPHQERQVVPLALTARVPEAVPPRRAVLTANMETALNAVWDSGAGPGDCIVIVGAGIVGLLIARLCARMPGTQVRVVDIMPERASIVQALGARFGGHAAGAADVVFHTSATAAGLETALGAAGFEATIVEVSWFGAQSPPVPLGAAFHSQRLRLISSQVGQIATTRRPRWDYARRRATAIALLADDALDALITEEIAFDALAAAAPRLLGAGAPGLQTVVRYGAADVSS